MQYADLVGRAGVPRPRRQPRRLGQHPLAGLDVRDRHAVHDHGRQDLAPAGPLHRRRDRIRLAVQSSTESVDAYDFGGRFYFAPFAGTRIYVNPRSFIRAEIRGAFWRLAYPPPYYEDITGILQSYAINNYLSNVWYQVGVGYSF